MAKDDVVVLTTQGDRPSVTLARLASICAVDPAQIVRWAWTGRIPPPEKCGRRMMWRRVEIQWIKVAGPGIPGSFPSLPHYDGLRMLEALRIQQLRARGVRAVMTRKPGGAGKGGAA